MVWGEEEVLRVLIYAVIGVENLNVILNENICDVQVSTLSLLDRTNKILSARETFLKDASCQL